MDEKVEHIKAELVKNEDDIQFENELSPRLMFTANATPINAQQAGLLLTATGMALIMVGFIMMNSKHWKNDE